MVVKSWFIKMKLSFKLLSSLFLFFLFLSCISDEEYRTSETPSVFKGEWSGVYSGDDSGTITFSVSDSGGFFGDKISNFGLKEGFNGYAKIGNFTASTPSNYIFISRNTPNNYEISGTWSQNDLKGIFVVRKK